MKPVDHAHAVHIDDAIAALTFLSDRTPETTDEEAEDAFSELARYRDGGIYVGHWAGNSEWECHPVGDEIVMIIAGATTMFSLIDEGEVSTDLAAGEIIVVPRGTWHRFETRERVKVMSVTPQPTDHSATRPT